MKKVIPFVALLTTIIISCQNHPSSTAPVVKSDTLPAVSNLTDSFAGLKKLHFDYAKDPSCGMPLSVEVEDTTHYKGKLYGFCSKECKDTFLKDPGAYITKAK
ncbi:MAG: YHS domain-containing protein [Bacteroidota bacterium]